MSIKGKQIGELMNKASATAPDVTRPLKVIGDGNMLDGVKNIFNYALKEGEKSGFVKGSAVTVGVLGTLYLIPKGIKFVRQKISEKKIHEEMGEKIQAAFDEELMINNEEGGMRSEEN